MAAAYQCMLKTWATTFTFNDVTNLLLHAAALLPKHHTKDLDTLIEHSFIGKFF